MYWYKCWCEVRTRVLVSVLALAVACVFIVFYQQTMRDHADAPMTYAAYIWKSIYNSFGRDLFVIMSIAMASGGLLQEKPQGTLGFTLALPISRWQAIATRALIGYLGIVAMALVPAIVVPILSPHVGQHYPISQALQFSLLWACSGSAIYALTSLLSYLMEGEYSAMLVSIPVLMIYGAMLQLPWLSGVHGLDLFHVMNGEDMPFFDERQHLITGSLPWVTLAGLLAVSVSFVYVAGRQMQQRDFS
jgi:ABC-2 type transport system permease protein